MQFTMIDKWNELGAMNNMMSGINQPVQSGVTPPPIPVNAYHVAVNGQATGPFEMEVLKQMVGSGQLTADTVVWKAGMAEWVKAEDVDELKSIFVFMPPIQSRDE